MREVNAGTEVVQGQLRVVVVAEAGGQEDSNKLEEYSGKAVDLRGAEKCGRSACEDLASDFEDFVCALVRCCWECVI
jgi:hypothetical protein